MTKQEVIEHFGSASELARKLGISRSAVSLWGDYIPESRAYQIESITKGMIQARDLPVRPKAA